MEASGRVVVNLATGLEDPERVMVAFLVAVAAADAGKQVTMFLTEEAVRLAAVAEDALVEHAEIGGATPLWQWIGDGATVFSY